MRCIWPMAHGMMHDARVRDSKYFKYCFTYFGRCLALTHTWPRPRLFYVKCHYLVILDRRLYAYAYASHGIATLSRTAGFAFDASCFNDSRSVQRRGLVFAEAYSYTQTARDD